MSGLKIEVAYVNKADLFKPFINLYNVWGHYIMHSKKKKVRKTKKHSFSTLNYNFMQKAFTLLVNE